MKKKFGDRRDAVKVRNLDGMHKMMVHIKPLRCDSDVYINKKIDCTNLVKYYQGKKKDEKNNDITYFHMFSTAIAKVFYNRPLMNRFLINRNYYDRKNITLAFVAKVAFNDVSEEYLTMLKVNDKDNLFTIKDRIKNKVKEIRSDTKNDTNNAINIIGKLPKPLVRFVVWVLKKLDNHDLLPQSLIENDIYHSSVILSNLGSINCGSIYHNLTDFGTSSILITMGEIKKEPVVLENGKIESRYVCDFGINLDERIADGFYFVKSVNLLEYILLNPELLEGNIDEKIEFKSKK